AEAGRRWNVQREVARALGRYAHDRRRLHVRDQGEIGIDWLLSLTRLLHYTASVSLAGTFAFWCLIAWPAFRKTNTSRSLAAREDRIMTAIAWASLLISLVTGAAWLVSVGANMSGMPV